MINSPNITEDTDKNWTADVGLGQTREYMRGGRHLTINLNQGTLRLYGKDVCVDIILNEGQVELLGLNIRCFIHQKGKNSVTDIDRGAKNCNFYFNQQSSYFQSPGQQFVRNLQIQEEVPNIQPSFLASPGSPIQATNNFRNFNFTNTRGGD